MGAVIRGEQITRIGYSDVIDMLEEDSNNLSIGMFNNKKFLSMDRFSSFEEFFLLISKRSVHYHVCTILQPEIFIVRIDDSNHSDYNERIKYRDFKEEIYKDLKKEKDFHIFNMNATY